MAILIHFLNLLLNECGFLVQCFVLILRQLSTFIILSIHSLYIIESIFKFTVLLSQWIELVVVLLLGFNSALKLSCQVLDLSLS